MSAQEVAAELPRDVAHQGRKIRNYNFHLGLVVIRIKKKSGTSEGLKDKLSIQTLLPNI